MFATVAVDGQARAVDSIEPLVVVVETFPGGSIDPGEVRRTIAEELSTPVRAPGDGLGEESSDLLIVAANRGEIRLSLRRGTEGIVSRAVPAPRDRKSRLKSIGWLAGNLARDQVSPLVAATPAGSDVEPPVSSTELPSVLLPKTEPPPFAKQELRSKTPAAAEGVVARASSPAGSDGFKWSLALGGGPTALWSWSTRPERTWPGPGIWSLELQHRASADGFILGAALDAGPDMLADLKGSPTNFMGLAVLVGAARRFGKPFVEATGGLGVEAFESTGSEMTTSANGMVTTTTSYAASLLGLYLRGQLSAGLALSSHFDLLGSLGGHLGNVTRFDHFLTTALAVRFRFPR